MFFNRAPNRTTPQKGIISPASGRVIEVREALGADIVFAKKGVVNQVSIPEIEGAVHVVLIEMTPTDVHVQRAPIAGEIIRMDHYDGAHKSALGKMELDLVEVNEKTVTVFRNEKDIVGVVQVAGVAARRIRNTLAVGTHVAKGDQYGQILLGSQVVVIIPVSHELLVKVEDRMVDGETLIAYE